jgi:hypothetical protein
LATGIAAVAILFLCGYVLRQDQFTLGDGLYVYQVFYDVFTQLTQTGAIPRWFPYSNFEMTADLRQFTQPSFNCGNGDLGVKNA